MQSAGVAKKVSAFLKPEAQHLINIKKLFNCESIDITVLGSFMKRVTKCRSQGTSPAPWESHTSWRMSFRKKGLWTCKISFKDLSRNPFPSAFLPKLLHATIWRRLAQPTAASSCPASPACCNGNMRTIAGAAFSGKQRPG